MTIDDVRGAISAGSSATEQVTLAFKRIEESKSYNAVIATLDKRALERAKEIDRRLRAGEDVGSLAGVPFIAKDNFLTFGAHTTAASKMLKNFDAPYQSTAIERLEAEGAICVAKANLDAFAHGSSTENSDFGPTKNPVDPDYAPGGSSGGSAAAVVLGLVPFALGTDTGGSIRLPASYCGAVGFKPTYGAVSRFGVVAMASSTDVIGPLANTVEDTVTVMRIISGKDERDATTLPGLIDYDKQADLPGFKVGVIKEYMGDGLDDQTRQAIEGRIAVLKSHGVEVEEVSLPSLPLALAVYYIVVPAEISSNLARYDGVKYGYSDEGARSLSDQYEHSRTSGFNDENIRRILIGNYVLSSGYYDAYYQKAQTVRTLIREEFDNALSKYDVLIGPTAPGPAFKLGQNISDPLQMYLVDIMTVAASIAGLPSISIPAGTVNGMPVGLQIIGQQKNDGTVLSVAQKVKL